MMSFIYSVVFFKELSQTKHQYQMDRMQSILSRSPSNFRQALECCWEKGASSWLSVIPIAQHRFALHKTNFTDAQCLHYGWSPPHLPSHCVCGKDFSISHALSCLLGAFSIIRHNNARNFTARLMSEVCHDVQLEPHLQPLSGELLRHKYAKHEDDTRVDIRAAGFWAIVLFLTLEYSTLLLNLISLHVKLQHFGGMKVISVGLMRSVSGKWNVEVLCHLYSPPLGVWVRLPLLHIDALPLFSVTNGTFHIL